MAWQSRLAGYEEIRGTHDPILFRYPSRSAALAAFVGSLAGFAVAWMLIRFYPRDPAGNPEWILGALPALLGFFSLLLGVYHLFVHRRLEVHERDRTLVTVKRTPFGGESRDVFPFAGMDQLLMETPPAAGSGGKVTLVLLMKDGRHIDLGSSYGAMEGGYLAQRLRQLTGIGFSP